MGETPSNRRRRGRLAFVPDGDPVDFSPYHFEKVDYEDHSIRKMVFKENKSAEYKYKDWLEGWMQAAADQAATDEVDVCEACGRPL